MTPGEAAQWIEIALCALLLVVAAACFWKFIRE